MRDDTRLDMSKTIFHLHNGKITYLMASEDVPDDIPSFVPLIREEPNLVSLEHYQRPPGRHRHRKDAAA